MTIRIDGTNTAANPGITGTDTDTGLQFGTDEVRVVTGGSTAVTVDSSQRVGVGTSNPSGLLHVSGSSNQYQYYESTTDNNAGSRFKNTGREYGIFLDGGNGASNSLRFYDFTASAERMRIDSSGRVGIGATSPQTMLQIGDGNSGNGVPKLRLHRGSGSDYFELDCLSGAPRLHAVGGGDMKIFTGNTEHMRFRANGGFIAFNDGTSSTVDAVTTRSAGTTYAYFTGVHSATGPTTGGTVSLRIWTNGDIQNTNGNYTSLSDAKLKENIVDAESQWSDLKAVRIRNWNFKEETGHETHRQIGPVAQELEQVCPNLVYDVADLDKDGNDLGTTTKSVRQSVLFMKAVKALQEAMERIEQLETRLTALEGGTN